MQEGEVVENKRLSEVMDIIQERQRERTEAKIARSATPTLRGARLRRAGAHRRTTTGSSKEAQP